VPNTIAGDRSDEPKVTNIDPKYRHARPAKTMRCLEQCPIPATGDYKVCLQISQVRRPLIHAPARRERLQPLLLNAFPVEDSFERLGSLLCVAFGLIDQYGYLADFHVRSFR
jgi:hypothetical protein